MSPASQGGLEVERYIGTCLISTHSRSGAGPAAKATAAAAAVAAAGGGGPAGVSAPLGKPRSKGQSGGNVYSFGPRYGRLGGPGSSQPHAQPPPWAGLPLISLAAAQHRRPAPPGSSASADDGLAQLAMRTQGAPLILAGRYHQHHSHTSNIPGGRPGPHHAARPRPTGTRAAPVQRPTIPPSAVTPASTPPKEGKSSPGDNLSVASDESSGGHSSENSLPRIIKPRKRRKKDRKPPPTTATSPSVPVSPSQSPPPPNPQTPPSASLSAPSHSSDETVPLYRNGEISTVSESTPSKPAVGTARAPGSSTEPEVRSINSDSEACSSCQCRYCDPAGRVWAAVPGSGAPLRRSWSEPPPSTISMDAISRAASPPPASVSEDAENGALQVSTHIVTSLHGHRDLEIRFFSSSPPQRVTPVPAAVAPAPPRGSPWGSSSVVSEPPPSPPPVLSPQPQVQLPGRPPSTTTSAQKNLISADDAECNRRQAEE